MNKKISLTFLVSILTLSGCNLLDTARSNLQVSDIISQPANAFVNPDTLSAGNWTILVGDNHQAHAQFEHSLIWGNNAGRLVSLGPLGTQWLMTDFIHYDEDTQTYYFNGETALTPEQVQLITPPLVQSNSPIWLQSPKFNNDAPTNAQATNYALDEQISDFFNTYALGITREFSDPDTFNFVLSDIFKESLLYGWQQETYVADFPFNSAFLAAILEHTSFYFAVGTDDNHFEGFYRNRLDESHVFINSRSNPTDMDTFSFTAIHELGHVLALGENLSDLLAEELTGIDFSRRSFSRDDRNYLSYNSTFVRTLLNVMRQSGREAEFWAAAFHSNTAFRTMWNQELEQIIPFDTLFDAKAADFFSFIGSESERVSSEFTAEIGMTRQEAAEELIHDWVIISNHYLGLSLAPAHLNRLGIDYDLVNPEAALHRFVDLTERMADFSRTRGFTHPAVFDRVVESHIHRLQYNS